MSHFLTRKQIKNTRMNKHILPITRSIIATDNEINFRHVFSGIKNSSVSHFYHCNIDNECFVISIKVLKVQNGN